MKSRRRGACIQVEVVMIVCLITSKLASYYRAEISSTRQSQYGIVHTEHAHLVYIAKAIS